MNRPGAAAAASSHPLHALISQAEAAVPGLEGRIVTPAHAGPAWHAGHRVGTLQRRLATQHPEAGPHYAALTGWSLLVWKPLYLGVIAVHLHGGIPDFERLSLRVDAGQVGPYRWVEHTPVTGLDEPERLHRVAAQLSAGLWQLLDIWQQHAPLHAKAASRVCATCALGALLALQRVQPNVGTAITRERGCRWLDALGLRGQAGYLEGRAPCGEPVLLLQRKVCCLDFRRLGGSHCSTCPQRTLKDRLSGSGSGG